MYYWYLYDLIYTCISMKVSLAIFLHVNISTEKIIGLYLFVYIHEYFYLYLCNVLLKIHSVFFLTMTPSPCHLFVSAFTRISTNLGRNVAIHMCMRAWAWVCMYVCSFTRVCSKNLFNLWRCPWCNGYSRRKWTRWHVQILDEADCISHSTNTLGNPIILPPAMGK